MAVRRVSGFSSNNDGASKSTTAAEGSCKTGLVTVSSTKCGKPVNRGEMSGPILLSHIERMAVDPLLK